MVELVGAVSSIGMVALEAVNVGGYGVPYSSS